MVSFQKPSVEKAPVGLFLTPRVWTDCRHWITDFRLPRFPWRGELTTFVLTESCLLLLIFTVIPGTFANKYVKMHT